MEQFGEGFIAATFKAGPCKEAFVKAPSFEVASACCLLPAACCLLPAACCSCGGSPAKGSNSIVQHLHAYASSASYFFCIFMNSATAILPGSLTNFAPTAGTSCNIKSSAEAPSLLISLPRSPLHLAM